jgi:hypothetical protein
MKYPHIRLKIEDSVPSIYYYPEEGNGKPLITSKESISELMHSIAKKLELMDEDQEDLEFIMKLLSEGDPRIIEVVPAMDKYKEKFGFEDFIMSELNKAEQGIRDLEQYGDISDEVRAELNRHTNLDIFSSLFDIVCNIMIAKTLLFSSDLGIGTIYLEDLDGIVRLREKMVSELSKMGIKLNIL